MSDIPAQLRSYIQEELRGLYTIQVAIIEDYDPQRQRCEAALKDDRNVLIDEVPVASAYAGDGFGEIHPISENDEGLLLCLKDPIDDLITERGHVTVPKQRQHSFQDAVFFPRFWYDSDTVPPHEEGEYLLAHESGSFISMKMDGTVTFAHEAGNHASINPDGSIELANADDTVTAQLSDTGVSMTAPDTDAKFTPDAMSGLSVSDDGRVVADGRTTVGDADANRVDSLTEAPPDSSREYAEVDEPVAPIIDPTDTAETEYVNPATTRTVGPIDFQGFETRRRVPERREADPDPAVTDPMDPAYYPGEKIPIGYEYILTETWEYKMWGSADAPVVIKPL